MNLAIKHYATSLPFPFSKAVEVGGILYLSGQVSMTPDASPVHGDIRTQTRIIMNSICETLDSLDSNIERIFKVTVWLSDMKHFSDFNQAYATYFSENLPVRSVVSAKLAFDLDVEIEVQALAANRD